MSASSISLRIHKSCFSTVLLVFLLLAGMTIAAGITSETVFAATETATVGQIENGGHTVTAKNILDLGTVDLPTQLNDNDTCNVTRRYAIQFENDHEFYYNGIAVADSKPSAGTFRCRNISNWVTYHIVSFDVQFDATWLCAGTYTANLKVPIGNKVNANGGAYQCVKNEYGDGYTLIVPVKITLKGNNPNFAPAVKNVTAEAGNGYVEVSWSENEGCDAYSVFRREGKDEVATRPELDKYIYLATVNTSAENNWDNGGGFSDAFFADYYAENGKTYSYMVMAGGDTPYSGNPSKSASATPKASLRAKPAAPYWFDFKGSETNISMSWVWSNRSGQRDPCDNSFEPEDQMGTGVIDHFNVYRNGRLVKQVQQNAFSPKKTYGDEIYYSWETYIRDCEYNVPYTFWVTAVDVDGTESAPSNKQTTWLEEELDIEIWAYHVFYTTEYDENDDGDVIATYKGFSFDLDGLGIYHYKVWRKLAGSADSQYTRVNLITTKDSKKEMDTGVTKGKVYTYKIIGVSSDGQETEPVIINVAADADEGDYQGAPGGNSLKLNFRTADGEAAKLRFDAYQKGTYKLYRGDTLLGSWVAPYETIEYTDNPGPDGIYDYKVVWTSSKYPAARITSNICRFVKDTSDPDFDSFDKAPGKPKLTGRVLGYETANWLQLTWTPSNEGGAPDGYFIYRTDGENYNIHEWTTWADWTHPRGDEPANGRYWSVKGDVNEYRITDFTSTFNNEGEYQEVNPHRIWIVAYNEVGISEPSNVLEYECNEDGLLPWDVDETAPGAPTNVRLWTEWTPNKYETLGLNGNLYVSWGAPATGGAVDHYEVTFSYSNNFDGEITNITEDPFSINIGQNQKANKTLYYYNVGCPASATVTAVNSKGETAADPVTVDVTSVPAIEVKTAGKKAAKVSWTKLLGVEKETVEEFQIWRRADASAWAKVQAVDPSSALDPDYTYKDVYSWTDTDLAEGTTYEYYVAAIDNNGKAHKSQVQTAITSVLDAALDAPTNLTAKNDHGNVILSWTPSLAGGLPAHYELEYQTLDQNPDEDWSWSSIDLGESFGASNCGVVRSWDSYYTYHGDIVPSSMITQYGGQKLRLRVRAVPSRTVSQDDSAPSDSIEFTWPTESQVSRVKSAPDPITPTVTEGDGQVTLKWNKKKDGSAATYYQVVRTWGDNYGVVATFAADRNSYEWTDTDVVNGEQYTYELRPCNSYLYSYYSTQQWYHPWCYMHQVTAVPNGKTTDQKIAENVTALADELLASRPADLDAVTEEYHARILELSNNYDALTAYQKRLIGKNKCAEIEALINDILYHDAQVQYADDPQLLDVVDAIDALDAFAEDIGLDDENFVAYEEAVNAAQTAYDALPEDAKALVTNLQKLKDAQAHIKQLRKDVSDQAIADAISDRMVALEPENITAETLTDELERRIRDIRMDYDALTKAQKAKVSPDALENFEAAEESLSIINGAAHVHKLRHVDAVPATCCEAGNIAYYKCTKCGGCFVDAAGTQGINAADVVLPIDAAAHDWSDWTIDVDATCTESGTEKRVCRNNDSHTETRVLEAYDHAWDTGEITKEAAPGDDGIIIFRCTRQGCDAERTARIEVNDGSCANVADHVWGNGELTRVATCIAPGEVKSVCSKCGTAIKYETQIDPLAHDWSEWAETIPATCTESGTKHRECSLCEAEEDDLIPAPGHDWDDGVVTKEPLCAQTGIKTFTCNTCFNERAEIIPATEEHVWDEGVPVQRATSAQTGLKVHICEVCEGNMEEIIPVVNAAVKLSATSYTWNGKVKTPTVTVTNNGEKMDAAQYNVTQPNGRKNVGTYTISVALLGDNAGTYKASFKINPKGTSLAKLSPAKKAITVKWKKQGSKMSKARVTGYQVQLALNKKFTKGKKLVTIKGYKKTAQKVTKLKAKKKYFVRVRTYTRTGGKNYYSPWSKIKTVKTK